MQPTDKYHQSRLKSITKTLADSQASKKNVDDMIVKMTKSLEQLKQNSARLDEKIAKYKLLQSNVEKDPNFKMNPVDLKL